MPGRYEEDPYFSFQCSQTSRGGMHIEGCRTLVGTFFFSSYIGSLLVKLISVSYFVFTEKSRCCTLEVCRLERTPIKRYGVKLAAGTGEHRKRASSMSESGAGGRRKACRKRWFLGPISLEIGVHFKAVPQAEYWRGTHSVSSPCNLCRSWATLHEGPLMNESLAGLPILYSGEPPGNFLCMLFRAGKSIN